MKKTETLMVELEFTGPEFRALRRIVETTRTSYSSLVEGMVRTYLNKTPEPPRRDQLVKADDGQLFPSAAAAARALDLHPRLVTEVLLGRRKHTGGRTFTYVNAGERSHV